jgi:hypothetical protein
VNNVALSVPREVVAVNEADELDFHIFKDEGFFQRYRELSKARHLVNVANEL